MSDSLVRTDALGVRLASTLREQIVKGDIRPGTHLVEDTIAETHDISRGPVRDALKQLKLENLVEPRRRGVHVIGLDADEVRDLYSVRRAIEQLAVSSTIAMFGERSHTVMDDGLRGMSESRASANEFAEYDLQFHRGIYEASGNRRLLTLWTQIEPLFASMLHVTNNEDSDLTPAAEDHKRLHEAIVTRDGEQAAAILDSHLDGSQRRMLQALQRIWNGTDGQVT